jgi:cytochrome c556
MNKKLVSVALVAALSAGYALVGNSQVKPETLVKQRQAAMTLQGKYFGPLVGMLKGSVPFDAKIVARNAAYLDMLSEMPWDGFDPSTKGVKSAALPAVFTEGAKVKAGIENFQKAVDELVAASKGGNEAAIKAAIGNVGKACGGCHDNFREKQ